MFSHFPTPFLECYILKILFICPSQRWTMRVSTLRAKRSVTENRCDLSFLTSTSKMYLIAWPLYQQILLNICQPKIFMVMISGSRDQLIPKFHLITSMLRLSGFLIFWYSWEFPPTVLIFTSIYSKTPSYLELHINGWQILLNLRYPICLLLFSNSIMLKTGDCLRHSLLENYKGIIEH